MQAAAALERFVAGASRLEPLGRGLINATYLAEAGGERFVLQRVSPIFDPAIHHNIRAVTRQLERAGLATPHLIETPGGEPYATLEDGSVWRLMTYVDGVSFERVSSPAQAAGAAQLVARFHRALEGLSHRFVGRRLGVHDTAKHLARLETAVASHPGHRLHEAVRTLASEVARAAETLPPPAPQAESVCHGDPKISNVLFEGASGSAAARPLCLVDLDTVGPMLLVHELGDAWRSWCNPAGEDDAAAHLDLAIFEASWRAYAEVRPLERASRRALLHAVEWISLELCARFLTDALEEGYFGWDAERFAGRGEHNLARARSQWALHRSAIACRAERARILDV